MSLPGDRHVHSEWSWDARDGSMLATCARAVDLGLPLVAFTEHVDSAGWPVDAANLVGHEHLVPFYADGVLTPGALDVNGYLAAIERCREQYPALTILSGLEVGEPHEHPKVLARLLNAGSFDLVLGSSHGLYLDGSYEEVAQLLESGDPYDVMRQYLGDVARLITECESFAVLAHIDYPLRYWADRTRTGPFEPHRVEEEFRNALRLLAESGRAMEINTRMTPYIELIRWWREEGGRTVTFGSDAHTADGLALGFVEAARLAEAEGFRPGRGAHDLWRAWR